MEESSNGKDQGFGIARESDDRGNREKNFGCWYMF